MSAQLHILHGAHMLLTWGWLLEKLSPQNWSFFVCEVITLASESGLLQIAICILWAGDDRGLHFQNFTVL